MRIEIQCRDRMGITMDILAMVVKHRVNISGIELGENKLYLSLPGTANHTFLALQTDIKDIHGVISVSKVAFMPKEREHFELNVLLKSIAMPVLSIDVEGKILFANPAMETLFADKETLIGKKITNLLGKSTLTQYLSKQSGNRYGQNIVIKGTQMTMDSFPVEVQEWRDSRHIGAVLCFHYASNTEGLSKHGKSTNLDPDAKMVYHNFSMRKLVDDARKIAASDYNLLICGELGSGKTLLARFCYLEGNINTDTQQWVLFDCAAHSVAQSDNLLFAQVEPVNEKEPDQQGYFFSAAGATLCLRNIDQLALPLQVKLRRLLTKIHDSQDKRSAIKAPRIIATACANLPAQVSAGAFDQELFYFLNTTYLEMPSLRQRGPKDIKALVYYFLEQLLPQAEVLISEPAMVALQQYSWPGNCLQLRNCLRQAVVLSGGQTIALEHIKLEHYSQQLNELSIPDQASEGHLEQLLKDYEYRILKQLYPQFPSTRKLAKRLGLSHTAVANKLRDFGIR